MKKIFKHMQGEIKLFREIVLGRLGFQNDFVGYESLVEVVREHRLFEQEGDFLEIGAFMGGGSRKLARCAAEYGKKLHTIDLFDPDFDPTRNERGEAMSFIYRRILGKKDLRKVFDRNTAEEKNLLVYGVDSKKVELPENLKLCFSFIDGNHDPDYVKHDFRLAWNRTVSGGMIACHDFGGDLPQTTSAIREMIEEHKNSVARTCLLPEKTIILISKKR